MGMVAEGLTAAPAIWRWPKRCGVEMPITENVVAVHPRGQRRAVVRVATS